MEFLLLLKDIINLPDGVIQLFTAHGKGTDFL